MASPSSHSLASQPIKKDLMLLDKKHTIRITKNQSINKTISAQDNNVPSSNQLHKFFLNLLRITTNFFRNSNNHTCSFQKPSPPLTSSKMKIIINDLASSFPYSLSHRLSTNVNTPPLLIIYSISLFILLQRLKKKNLILIF